jgi:hypothetical protein
MSANNKNDILAVLQILKKYNLKVTKANSQENSFLTRKNDQFLRILKIC